MSEFASVSEKNTCPGCHFECKLVNYQCGRGKEFYDVAAAGGEVPVRRGPMQSPSEIAAGKPAIPSVNERVMHGFTIMANKMQQQHAEAASDKVVTTLARQGQFMSLRILAKRTLLSPDELDAGLEEASLSGYVTMEVDDRLGRYAKLTAAGKEHAAALKERRDANTAEFLAALTEEEKEALSGLIRKVLGMR